MATDPNSLGPIWSALAPFLSAMGQQQAPAQASQPNTLLQALMSALMMQGQNILQPPAAQQAQGAAAPNSAVAGAGPLGYQGLAIGIDPFIKALLARGGTATPTANPQPAVTAGSRYGLQGPVQTVTPLGLAYNVTDPGGAPYTYYSGPQPGSAAYQQWQQNQDAGNAGR